MHATFLRQNHSAQPSSLTPAGHQDLPEKEELSNIQLPAVLLPVRHASPALREPVYVPIPRAQGAHLPPVSFLLAPSQTGYWVFLPGPLSPAVRNSIFPGKGAALQAGIHPCVVL